ncbi:hypothetical protein [Comamonas humi]
MKWTLYASSMPIPAMHPRADLPAIHQAGDGADPIARALWAVAAVCTRLARRREARRQQRAARQQAELVRELARQLSPRLRRDLGL